MDLITFFIGFATFAKINIYWSIRYGGDFTVDMMPRTIACYHASSGGATLLGND